MARLDHYENGKWVGSTEAPDASIEPGWINTYSSDGKSRTTYVSQDSTTYNSVGSSGIGGAFLFTVVCVVLLGSLLSIANPLIFFVLKNRESKSKPKFYKEEIVFKVSKILFVLQMISLAVFLVLFACSIIFMPQIIEFLEQYR